MKRKEKLSLTVVVSLLFITSFAQQDTSLYKYKTGHTWKSIAVPLLLITYGSLHHEVKAIGQLDISTDREIREDHKGFHTKADEYLQWAPTATLALAHLFKIPTQHNFKDKFKTGAISLASAALAVYSIKAVSPRLRPDSSENNSFPSFHSANSFMSAEIVRQEFKSSCPVLSYSGYFFAVATSTLRVYNKTHWVSDVVMGAGIGILSAKFGYWCLHRINQRRKKA